MNGDATPSIDAAKAQCICRVHLFANCRVHTIASHSNVGFHGHVGVVVGVEKIQMNAIVILRIASASHTGVHFVCAQSADCSIKQNTVQFSAVRANFWQCIASVSASSFFVDKLAVVCEEDTFQVFNTGGLNG